jgi:dipeptidyl aminopeptidase/acylaminoacyl peptidase
LLARRSFPSAVSPDGKLIAVVLADTATTTARHLAVLPIEGGEPQIIAGNLDFGTSFLRWTADGRALAYVLTRHGVSNIGAKPLPAVKPRHSPISATELSRMSIGQAMEMSGSLAVRSPAMWCLSAMPGNFG